jgi:hypothetical protein
MDKVGKPNISKNDQSLFFFFVRNFRDIMNSVIKQQIFKLKSKQSVGK